MPEHAITVGATLPIVLEPTVISYHRQVISLEAINLAEN
jgi:hypothetical protein